MAILYLPSLANERPMDTVPPGSDHGLPPMTLKPWLPRQWFSSLSLTLRMYFWPMRGYPCNFLFIVPSLLERVFRLEEELGWGQENTDRRIKRLVQKNQGAREFIHPQIPEEKVLLLPVASIWPWGRTPKALIRVHALLLVLSKLGIKLGACICMC